jgi:hypothetical protein
MLGKLLKYEIPAMGRKMLPLYAAWAVTALLFGLSTQAADSKSEFMVVITALLYTAIATAIMVMTVILIVQRYSNSLLGNEGYFNHVLPVSTSAHIGNKLISATFWVIVTMLVAILTALLIALGAILVGAADGLSLSQLFHELGQLGLYLPDHFGLYVFEVLLLIAAAIVKTIMQIYAAITIGHQASNHTALASIGAYILVLIFESVIGRILMPVFANIEYNADGFMNFNSIFVPALIATAAFSAIYFFVCKFLMEKRLNLT